MDGVSIRLCHTSSVAMGCVPSKYSEVYMFYPKVGKHKKDFAKLRFTEVEIGKLFHIFCKIDVDQ